MNLQFAGNFPDSILNFNLSALNDFSQKNFVAEAIDDYTSGPPTTMSLYSSVDCRQYLWSSSCVLAKALRLLLSFFSLHGCTSF